MADFCHANGPLVRRCFPGHQLIFEVNFNHFAHQPIRSTAHGGNLLQDGQTGVARFQCTLKSINLPSNAADACQNTFFYLRVNAAYALLIL